MSNTEQIIIPTTVFNSTTQNCFDGIDVSVSVLGLQSSKAYRLTLTTLVSQGGLSDDQPTMLLFPSTGSTEAALPTSLPSFDNVTSKDFTYKIRLQNDELYMLGYKLERKGRFDSDSSYTVIANPEQNSFFVNCGGVAPFLTPTPTVTEIAQMQIFNLNEVLEKGEVVFELRGDSFVESELPVSLDSDGKIYIRKPGEDLIKVVQLNSDSDAEVTDYLIVPSPTPTLTQTVTNTSTPTPTPIDVFQKSPFTFSFDTSGNLFTLSISTAYLKPPSGNTVGNVNTIQFKFTNLKLTSGTPTITTEPNISTGLALPPSLINNGEGFVIANNAPLFNLSDIDKLKITIPYDPASTNTTTAAINNFQITDGTNDYTLKDMVFNLNNDGTLSNIIGLYNFLPAGSDTTIGAVQANFNNQLELTPNTVSSTFPAELTSFTIQSQTSSAIAFADGSITFDRMSYLETITDFNAASSNLSSAQPTSVILADGNDVQYTNVYSSS